MGRDSLGLAFALGLVAGVVLGQAWLHGFEVLWMAGAVILCLGALVALHAVQRAQQVWIAPRAQADNAWEAAPPVGQMLIRCGMISEADLVKALERQRKTGGLLGEVLVKMKVVTYAQLAEVLEEQLARRRHRREGAVPLSRG